MIKKINNKNRKKTSAILLLLLAVNLSGCSNPAKVKELNAYLEEAYTETEEETYPQSDELTNRLEEAGYQTERFDSFDELGLDIDRVKASKDEQYLDICYNVANDEDVETIMDYYMEHYEKYNLVNNDGTVYCYSSETVMEDAGLW